MNKFASITMISLLLFSCRGKVEPGIRSGIDECENCTMIINNVDQGAVSIDSKEILHTFCSPVCMINGNNTLKQNGADIPELNYLFDHNDIRPIRAEDAVIVHGDFHTAMGHGLLAFADEASADSFASEVNGEILNWNNLRAEYEIPDTEIKLNCRTDGEPGLFQVERNDVVSVCIEKPGGKECPVTLKGYNLEFGDGDKTTNCAGFVADRPGRGFVFVNSENEILASLFVSGEHTEEEKLYK